MLPSRYAAARVRVPRSRHREHAGPAARRRRRRRRRRGEALLAPDPAAAADPQGRARAGPRNAERRARLVPRPRESRVHHAGRRVPRAERDGAGGLAGARGSRRCGASCRTRAASWRPSRRTLDALPDLLAGDGRRRAAPRARAVRLLPVRVAVLDAQGRGAAAARAQPARAARGPRAQGRVAVQRAVARHAAGVHRRRLVRAPAPGRAVGGLPAVLHAVPVSADAAGLQGPAVPRGAARLARRDRAARRARACSPASASARACSSNVLLHARLESRYAGAEGGEVKREMRRAGFNKELLAANFGKLEKLVRAARVEGRRDGLDRLRRGQHLRRRGGRRARRSSCARRRRAGASRLAWDVGCNDGRYARIAAESADLVVAFDADHATVDALYRRLREERRDGHPAARHERHRPVARPRLARARAGLARAPRDAGAGALPRRRAPRLHHRQRPGARVPRLAALARRARS